jgi:hypothetical protein
MNPSDPIGFTSDYGHIGNLWWVNSSTMPEMDLYTYRLIRYWGCFFFGPPDPNICYTVPAAEQ